MHWKQDRRSSLSCHSFPGADPPRGISSFSIQANNGPAAFGQISRPAQPIVHLGINIQMHIAGPSDAAGHIVIPDALKMGRAAGNPLWTNTAADICRTGGQGKRSGSSLPCREASTLSSVGTADAASCSSFVPRHRETRSILLFTSSL